ncbi:hypothetical protein INT46_010873 [Mucor plumbeus]|uniref:Uncharacterized protein n=1 Tax=Mucor plumbeus TaxID=97098 RepID=A0A8H7UNQ5_9FUNG|nr:hypothetical protein INT46_010873 [Mucor plumbeus]
MPAIETATATNRLEQQQQHHHQQDDAFDTENKSKMETSRNFIMKLCHQAQFYWDAIKVNLINFWQLQEFKLGVYIFGLLSVIPAAFFLLFLALVIIFTTVLVSFVWIFFVCSALTIGLMILVPILFVCSIIVGFLTVGYYVYQYLLRLRQANRKTN